MHIAIFFSYKTSLKKDWFDTGLAFREIKPFIALNKTRGYKFTFYTYGGAKDVQMMKNKSFKETGIKVVYIRSLFNIINPTIFFKRIRELNSSDVIMSLQTTGLISALPFSLIFRKKLISRSGYDVFSFGKAIKVDKWKMIFLFMLERLSEIFARYHIFATDSDLNAYNQRNRRFNRLLNKKTKENKLVISNWVDTKLFDNKNEEYDSLSDKKEINLLSIGRLEEQKNYVSFINELGVIKKKINLEFNVKIIGEGSLYNKIYKAAKKNKIKLEILDNMPHQKLILHILNCDIYFQSSLYEGNPKTLLEAMSSKSIVLCRDSDGIRNIVQNELNGYLYRDGFLYEAIYKIVNNTENNKYRKCARETILNKYSLDGYLEKFSKIIKSIN